MQIHLAFSDFLLLQRCLSEHYDPAYALILLELAFFFSQERASRIKQRLTKRMVAS
jgi:hypothetical protein